MHLPHCTLNNKTSSVQLSNHQQYGKTDAHPSVLIPASKPTPLLYQFPLPFYFSPGLILSKDHCTAVPLSVLKCEEGQGQVEKLRAT